MHIKIQIPVLNFKQHIGHTLVSIIIKVIPMRIINIDILFCYRYQTYYQLFVQTKNARRLRLHI